MNAADALPQFRRLLLTYHRVEDWDGDKSAPEEQRPQPGSRFARALANHAVQVPTLGHALQLMAGRGPEDEPGASDEILHSRGDEDLRWPC